MRCVLATSNRHKCDEIGAILVAEGIEGIQLSTLADYPHIVPAAETGQTFSENARLKALHVARATGELALADDSGLVVDALDGAPGIHSARYAGPNASDADRIHKLLSELDGIPNSQRTARFVCSMVLASPDGVLLDIEGVREGRIASDPVGDDGFGYDPVFLVPERAKTMAQLGPDVKNRISHRARAIHALASDLQAMIRTNATPTQ